MADNAVFVYVEHIVSGCSIFFDPCFARSFMNPLLPYDQSDDFVLSRTVVFSLAC